MEKTLVSSNTKSRKVFLVFPERRCTPTGGRNGRRAFASLAMNEPFVNMFLGSDRDSHARSPIVGVFLQPQSKLGFAKSRHFVNPGIPGIGISRT